MNRRIKVSKSEQSKPSGGIGFAGLLTIAFIVLKLLDKIEWSWWWVLSPIWITAALVFVLTMVASIIVAYVD